MRRAPGAVTHLIDKVWALGIVPHTESWIESDGSPASAPKRRGFGTIVMEADGGAQRGQRGGSYLGSPAIT
jgi:hypothetical protein